MMVTPSGHDRYGGYAGGVLRYLAVIISGRGLGHRDILKRVLHRPVATIPGGVLRTITATITAAFLAFGVGCGSDNSAAEMQVAGEAENGGDASAEYQVILGNAITDTMSGNADFGRVVEPESGEYRFVIRLETGFDFAGGLIFARADTALPATGDYRLATETDSLTAKQPSEFAMFYREGMLRELRATQGTLTLSTVTDSVIAGSFDATLRGRVANMNQQGQTAEVHATGRFRADRDLGGYVIGL